MSCHVLFFLPTDTDLPAIQVADNFKSWIERIVLHHEGELVMESGGESQPQRVYHELFHHLGDTQKEAIMLYDY